MPHMSNLPWMGLYVNMFLIMILTSMIFSLPYSNKLTGKKYNIFKTSKKLKWLW